MSARVVVALVGLISLAACVDLKKGRAYRCEQDGDCAAGWQCLKDSYCHAPDVGADVPCLTTADDCTGGWVCGNAKRCLNPAEPSDFPCADDSQCVGGWRCSGLGRCADFSKEPQPALFRAAGDVSLISPLTEPAPWLSVSPPIQGTLEDGEVFTAVEVLRPRGESVERLFFASIQEDKSSTTRNLAFRSELHLGFEARALVSTWGMFAAVRPDGGLALALEDGGLDPDPDAGLGFVPRRLVPLSWVGPVQWSGIAALSDDHAEVLFPNGRVSLGAGVRDVVTAWGPDGGLRLGLLKLNSTELVTVVDPMDLMAKAQVVVTTDGGADTRDPDQLRFEGGDVAVSFNLDGFVAGRQGARVACANCADQLGPMLTCGDSRPFSDFGLLPRGALGALPIAACESGSLVVGVGAGTVIDFREGVKAGTSGAHVRQLPTGQLLFSRLLGEEIPSVLASRPRALTVRRDGVLALAGGSLFIHLEPDDPGLALASMTTEAEEQLAGFVEGDDLVLAARGFTIGDLPDGGARVEYFLNAPDLLGNETRARLLPTDAGVVLVVSDGDALYSAQRDPDTDPDLLTIAEARLRPAAGFTLTDWALRGGAGLLLEGWAVANNRLFRLTASTVERWRASEVTFPSRDPLGVWFAGDAALLGTASGEVLALPSGVPVAPALGDVLSIDGLCGTTVATTSPGGVWQLVAAPDGGLGEWRPLPTRALEEPRVVVTDGHLLLTDENGVVVDVAVTCP